MAKNVYEEEPRRSEDEIDQALSRNDAEELLHLVISVSMYHEDLDRAHAICVGLSSHQHHNVRGNAILGFGHLARRFGRLDVAMVKPIIEGGLKDADEYVRGQSWAAADDVTHFLGWHVVGFKR